MKKLLLSAASLALLTSAAVAAGLPLRKAEPILLPSPPPPMWTGFYVGLTAGGTWATTNNAQINYNSVYSDARNKAAGFVSNTAALLSSYSVPTNSVSGFVGGGQIGFNEIIATNYVMGLETDFSGITTSNANAPVSLQTTSFSFYSIALQRPVTDTLTNGVVANKNVAALGTARMRLGYLITPSILVYGTGGLAYGLSNYNTFAIQDIQSPITDEIGPGGSSKSVFRLGWAAGGGVEWMFMNNWSIKAEYLYYDLGTASLYLGQAVSVQKIQTPTSGIPVGQVAQVRNAVSNVHFTGNIVRAGVNYHFNWGAVPVVAKY